MKKTDEIYFLISIVVERVKADLFHKYFTRNVD